MSGTIKDEKEHSAHRPVMLFGKDLMEIRCFRNSFIFGICSGVAGGLLCFLATSKTLFSTHMSFASLWVGVFAYWFPCRYKYESQQLVFEKLREKAREEKRKRREEEMKEMESENETNNAS